MGGGHSQPVSVENDGINISGNYGGNSQTNYSNISTGGSSSDQSASSTGAGVKAGVDVKVPIPTLLQNLMTNNKWDLIRHAGERLGHEEAQAVEHCVKDTDCKAKAEEGGANAVYEHYHHKHPKTL